MIKYLVVFAGNEDSGFCRQWEVLDSSALDEKLAELKKYSPINGVTPTHLGTNFLSWIFPRTNFILLWEEISQ